MSGAGERPVTSALIEGKHRLIPACDCDSESFRKLLKATGKLAGIGGYKVGFRLALELGLGKCVEMVRRSSDKPVIYDHQKAATDIPDTGDLFAELCAGAGVDGVILFPLTGPQVLKKWIAACQRQSLGVIVGGLMTHPGFLGSEGGFIADDASHLIYCMAADCGVTEFVVPGTRPEFSWGVYELLSNRGIQPSFYSPGIGQQGGQWQSFVRANGPAWHAIVGRSLYREGDIANNATAILETLVA